VYVDGRKKGLSPPLTELRLSPGRHTIELRNSTFAPYAETVNVEANASLRIRHKFR
jgi:serine/threonine-protein kinase